MQTESFINSIIGMCRHKVSQKNSSHRSRKKSCYISKYNNVLMRLKKLKANQQRQTMSMANNAFIRRFVNHVKQLKQAKPSTITRKEFGKHKKAIRQVVNSGTSMPKGRTILCQCGRGAFYHADSISWSGYQIIYVKITIYRIATNRYKLYRVAEIRLSKHSLFCCISKISSMELRLQCDRTMYVAGPKNSGKTSFDLSLLEH